MKSSVTLIMIFTFCAVKGLAQGRYLEGMPIKPNCPCEIPLIFRGRQSEINSRPFNPTSNCTHFLPINSTVPVGIYLFKRKRKSPSPTYPKNSTIVRL